MSEPPKSMDMAVQPAPAVLSCRSERQRCLRLAVIFAAISPRWLWTFTSPASLQRSQQGSRKVPHLLSQAVSLQADGEGTDEENDCDDWILKIRDLLQDLLKRNISYQDAQEWNRQFNLKTKRDMGAWSFTTNFTDAMQEIFQGVVGPVDLEKEGSQVDQTYSAARSDLDLWVKKRHRQPFTEEEKSKLVLALREKLFARKVSLGGAGNCFIAFQLDDEVTGAGYSSKHVSFPIDIGLDPRDPEDFLNLRCGDNRQINDRKINGFLKDHPSSRVAVSGLKRWFNTSMKGIVLKAVTYFVAIERKCVLSNLLKHQSSNINVNAEATVLFLTVLQELRDWNSGVFGETLRKDLYLQLKQNNSKRGLHLKSLSEMKNLIQSGSFYDMVQAHSDDQTYVNNTKMEPGANPDRHYFQLPNFGKRGNYKCIYCNDYNKGVGLTEDSRCRKCGGVQIEHPDWDWRWVDGPRVQEDWNTTKLVGNWVQWKPSRKKILSRKPCDSECRWPETCPLDQAELYELFQRIYRDTPQWDEVICISSGICSQYRVVLTITNAWNITSTGASVLPLGLGVQEILEATVASGTAPSDLLVLPAAVFAVSAVLEGAAVRAAYREILSQGEREKIGPPPKSYFDHLHLVFKYLKQGRDVMSAATFTEASSGVLSSMVGLVGLGFSYQMQSGLPDLAASIVMASIAPVPRGQDD
eukprot:Skav223859  [mRNA]  locus=scaffold2304:637276:656526:- [translate_table: standard]